MAATSAAYAATTPATPLSSASRSAHDGSPNQRATWAMYARQTESSQFRGSTGIAGTCPAIAASIPSHIAGATAGRAIRFAASDPAETVPKWWAISGAVATVAAMLIAVPSARARRGVPGPWPPSSSDARRLVQRKMPTTAAKLSCQPISAQARGSSARVTTAASRSAYQRELGLPARAATSPAAPIAPARWIEGPAPVTGT